MEEKSSKSNRLSTSTRDISARFMYSEKEKASNLLEFSDLEQQSSVFVDGTSLGHILKDETLTKLFLTLYSLCTLLVGSSVTPYQKRDLTQALRQFQI